MQYWLQKTPMNASAWVGSVNVSATSSRYRAFSCCCLWWIFVLFGFPLFISAVQKWLLRSTRKADRWFQPLKTIWWLNIGETSILRSVTQRENCLQPAKKVSCESVRAKLNKGSISRTVTSSKDSELDLSLWAASMKEVKKGFFEGGTSKTCQLEPKRFPRQIEDQSKAYGWLHVVIVLLLVWPSCSAIHKTNCALSWKAIWLVSIFATFAATFCAACWGCRQFRRACCLHIGHEW